MIRIILVLVAWMCVVTVSHAADPKTANPEWIIGEWTQVAVGEPPKWIFRPDGKATYNDGKMTQNGSYTIDFVNNTLEFREERDGIILPGKAVIPLYILERDRLLMDHKSEYSGRHFILKRPQFLP